MAEESLETAAEHERILREIESTDTACIGPTLRYWGGAGSAGAGGARRLAVGRVAGVPRPGRGPAGELLRGERVRRGSTGPPLPLVSSSSVRRSKRPLCARWNCPSQVLRERPGFLGPEGSVLPPSLPRAQFLRTTQSRCKSQDLATTWTCSVLPPLTPSPRASTCIARGDVRTYPAFLGLITLHLLHRARGFV